MESSGYFTVSLLSFRSTYYEIPGFVFFHTGINQQVVSHISYTLHSLLVLFKIHWIEICTLITSYYLIYLSILFNLHYIFYIKGYFLKLFFVCLRVRKLRATFELNRFGIKS